LRGRVLYENVGCRNDHLQLIYHLKTVALISKQITKNFFYLLLSNIVGQMFTLWAFVYVARVFGPEGFGKFSYAQVIALFFLYIADFGLQVHGTRVIAQEKGNIPQHVWDITWTRIVLAVSCFIVLVPLSLLLSADQQVRSLIVVFGIMLLPSAVLLEWVFQGIERMDIVGLSRVLKGFFFAGLVFLFLKTPDHLNYAAAFYVGGIALAAVVLQGIYVRKFGKQALILRRPVLWKPLVLAAPLAAGTFVGQINANFGTLALGFFSTNDEVGYFSAAYRIILFLSGFVVVAAANATLPLLARSYEKSTVDFSISVNKLLRVFALAALPLGIGGSILAHRIISFLYAAEYQNSVVVLQISIWAIVIMIYRVVFENALIASRNQRHYFMGFAMSGVLTVLGNIILVPLLGLIAPAIVAVVSEFVLLVGFALSSRFIRISDVARMTIKPLLSAVLMGAALWALPMNLFVALAVGILLYGTFLLLFRCVSIEEILGYVHSFVR
jgi:O-antigen/teichoic acid export membrane protein